MTSQNNPLRSEQGSALIVTMLLVSVLLVTALILLQRIIPYAKSVRSMHDASQAYYVARGQTDLARYNFLYGGNNSISLQFPSIFGLLSQNSSTGTTTIVPTGKRINIFDPYSVNTSTDDQLQFELPQGGSNGDPTIPKIGLPFTGIKKQEDAVVISSNNQNPLQIKFFPTNTSTEKFGTSRIDARYHTLYTRNAGGLRFDLRGVNTSDPSFTLKFQDKNTTTASGTITLKMQYYGSATDNVDTFTAEYELLTNGSIDFTSGSATVGNIQSITTGGSIDIPPSANFHSFLGIRGCSLAKICSLTLTLNPGGPTSIDFQLLSTNTQIPDLNAVVVGDGLSGNGIYYQRVIDLIPTPQDI